MCSLHLNGLSSHSTTIKRTSVTESKFAFLFEKNLSRGLSNNAARIIVLYRNTLLLDWNELRGEADQYASGEIWHPRLRNGPQLCLEAAKEMTNLQVMVTEAGEPTFLHMATSPLAAAYVLAIHIHRQPSSILSRTHSEVCSLKESRLPMGQDW